MSLDELEDLFDLAELPVDAPTPEQLYQMYGIFLNDFVTHKMTIQGKQLRVNMSKSNHFLFKGKAETFVHIVTRENKYTGKREYDRERANRIHWIRPVLENASDNRILFFEKINDKGVNQLYYWYKERDFIVIIREIKPSLLLITSFCVDASKKNMYTSWYRQYKNV
jgi:hypothetical protein